MAEPMSLDGILSDAPVEKPTEPVQEPVAAPKDPAEIPEPPKDPVEKQQAERNISRKQAQRDKEQLAQGRVRDPVTGQYVAKEEPKESTSETNPVEEVKEAPKEPVKEVKPAAPQQEFTEKEKAFLKAAQEERNKRQQLEAKLKEIESRLPKEPEKTFWDDPEAALAKQKQEMRQEVLNTRLATAEIIARQRHPDFDEKIAVFSEVLQQNPALHQNWLSAPDPAEFAYQTGKNHKELQEMGSMEELKAKIERETEARLRLKIEAELKAKAEALEKARADLPGSLSQARSTGTTNRPVWSGPTPLDSILGKG